MKVLYAGDSPVGGPANYLLAVLKKLPADVRHVPPSQTLLLHLLRQRFDAIILSDFSRTHLPSASESAVIRQVDEGTGLLMVGGWGSFSGPFGGWRGSRIESLLPVRCLRRDDRKNFPGGALITSRATHPMFRSLSFREPPAICGLNVVTPKAGSKILLTATPILSRRNPSTGGLSAALSPRTYPLLVISADVRQRVAALTTDLAPHWCGGLVDWGHRRVVLPVARTMHVEVGDRYLQFVSSLVRWLARANLKSY